MEDIDMILEIIDTLLKEASADTERCKKRAESANKMYQKALDRQRKLEILRMELFMSIK